jgi:hypothetical protein
MVKEKKKKGGIPSSFHTKWKKEWSGRGNYQKWIARKWKSSGNSKTGVTKKKDATKKGPKKLVTNQWVKKWATTDKIEGFKAWKKTLKTDKPSRKSILEMMKKEQWPREAVNCWQLRQANRHCKTRKGLIAGDDNLVKERLGRRKYDAPSWLSSANAPQPSASNSLLGDGKVPSNPPQPSAPNSLLGNNKVPSNNPGSLPKLRPLLEKELVYIQRDGSIAIIAPVGKIAIRPPILQDSQILTYNVKGPRGGKYMFYKVPLDTAPSTVWRQWALFWKAVITKWGYTGSIIDWRSLPPGPLNEELQKEPFEMRAANQNKPEIAEILAWIQTFLDKHPAVKKEPTKQGPKKTPVKQEPKDKTLAEQAMDIALGDGGYIFPVLVSPLTPRSEAVYNWIGHPYPIITPKDGTATWLNWARWIIGMTQHIRADAQAGKISKDMANDFVADFLSEYYMTYRIREQGFSMDELVDYQDDPSTWPQDTLI